MSIFYFRSDHISQVKFMLTNTQKCSGERIYVYFYGNKVPIVRFDFRPG